VWSEVRFVEEIMNSINTAFKAISSIPVTGDSVDAMAVARAQLRKAYADLEKMKEGVNADGHGS
jgi:hypothetical protein